MPREDVTHHLVLVLVLVLGTFPENYRGRARARARGKHPNANGRTRMAGGTVRGEPAPPAGGGRPDARLAERGRRCGPGGLAPAQPHRRRRRGEPRRLADDRRRTGLPRYAALPPGAARGAARFTGLR